MRYFACDGRGHQAVDSLRVASNSRNELKIRIIVFAEVTVINMDQQNMTLRIVKTYYRDLKRHNNDQADT